MTDLERARTLGGEKIIEGLKDALAHALVQRVLHIWSEEMAVERIAEALAAARREGAEAERRAALRAALPAEPPSKLIEAIAEAEDDEDVYRALRAHLLEEDA